MGGEIKKRAEEKMKEMFKLHRHKSDRLDNKVEFKFSSLQAFKVPRGWDKIFLSIISVETGKVAAKSGKATVRSGSCQWTNIESILVSQDEVTKELEESQLKIVVSMGSTRPAILGELVFNLADYLVSGDSGLFLLPLKNCQSGAALQVRIQCNTPKSKYRGGKPWRETSSHLDDLSTNDDDIDSKSDGSDNVFNRSAGSSSSSQFDSISYPDDLGNKDANFSASGSHHSSNSGNGSIGRTMFSPKNSLNGMTYVGRQDSGGSHGAGPNEHSKSNPSSFNSRASGSSFNVNSENELASSSIKACDSSKEFLEAAEEIEELRDEVKMWERHSRQLKLDLGVLKKEIADKAKHQAELDKELSAVYSERDSLKQEVEQLKMSLDKSMTKQTTINTCKNEGSKDMQKELEDEIKFLKESNANLTLQLKKTQESNIELVAILQELEETIEKQSLEIANLSKLNHVTEQEGTPRSQTLSDIEAEWSRKLSLKEEEILELQEKLSNMLSAQQPSKSSENHPDLIKELEVLKVKVQELERDCAELTDENLDLIFKMKALNKDVREEKDFQDSNSAEFQGHISPDEESQILLLKSRIGELEEELTRKEKDTGPSSPKLKNLEKAYSERELELQHYREEASGLQIMLQRSQVELDKKNLELSELQHKHGIIQEKNLELSNILERNLQELESCKSELESHISDVEQENVQLSERISGLEAQLRYLTNDKESNRLELEHSKSLITGLQAEIERQKTELEMQKVELKQKVQEAQTRTSEVLEESDVLRRSNSKFQSTIENLIEECSSLQKLIGDLKSRKMELHERLTLLEVELDQSQKKNIDFCKQIGFLETKLSSLQKDFVSKEKSLLSQFESIFQEHQEHDEKISQVHAMLNKMESEKTIEVENLEREIAQLTSEMTSTHDGREKSLSDALHEASVLRSDKAKLECSLQEADLKVKLCENDLQNLRQESKSKIQGLVDLLNASKQSEEMLMTDIEHLQRLLEGVKSSEEKYRKLTNEHELKLKSSDFEKQQMLEEISLLKVQVQKISHLQDEIVVLKGALDEAKFERRKLEELLKSVSEECEELKTERVSLNEKVLNMQKVLNNGEDDKRNKIALQEKLLRLESDLTAKEASYAYEAELKNELNRIKRTNSEYQRKIQSLELEKDEVMRKAQLMEKEFMLKMKHNQDKKVTIEDDKKQDNHIEVDQESKINLLEKQLSEALEANNLYKKQIEENLISNDGMEKISTLEAELKEMKERYLQMSLQYAEVEAQREELVMQLKSVKKEKRWFS